MEDEQRSNDERRAHERGDARGEEEYAGGVAAPPEGEQEASHESEETLSPDETGEA
ncbi:MAG TPA: hypothetical protein VLB86_09560 [Gaiellaceae bacterium]|nr:hypothetical protein [Gaiellaceae bacterium]